MTQGFTRGVPIDTDATLANNSDQLVASQKAVKTYVAAEISDNAPDLSGYATTSSVAAGYQPLDTQLTSLAGLSYSGNASKYVRVNAGETGFELNTVAGGGDVVGPASAGANKVVLFDGTTGKLIKDSGLSLSGSNTGDQTSIVGISGTIAEFNTACSDANFATGGGSATGANTVDATVSGAYDYITLSGQDIVRGQIDLATDVTGVLPYANGNDVVYKAAGANTAINSVTDVQIVSTNVTTSVGDQLEVLASFVILNDSTATRAITLTLDFDGAFDCEITTGALATSATLLHPIVMRGILNIRASNLSYAVFTAEGWAAAGQLAGADVTMSASALRAMTWGATTNDLSGTTTVSLHARSANATATQTLRLHSFSVRRLTP